MDFLKSINIFGGNDWFRKNRLPHEFIDYDESAYYKRHESEPYQGIIRDKDFYNPNNKKSRELFSNPEDYRNYKHHLHIENRFLHKCKQNEIWNERTNQCIPLSRKTETNISKRKAPSDVPSKKSKNEMLTLCQQISEIKRREFIAKGTEGAVYTYCVMGNCNYVAKITPGCNNTKYSHIQQEIITNNKAYDLGMAYKIHTVEQCINNECITIMDLAEGETLGELLGQNSTNVNFEILITGLIDALDKLHSYGIYHGDTNPQNEFFHKGIIKFIDFTYWEPRYNYKYYYDFCELFYYLYQYMKVQTPTEASNLDIMKEGYDVVINRLRRQEPQDEFLTFLIDTYDSKLFSPMVAYNLKEFVTDWIYRNKRNIHTYVYKEFNFF